VCAARGWCPGPRYLSICYVRARLASTDYSEIKIRLMFDPAAPAPNFEADWNKPPTAPMLVAIRSEDGKRMPKMMRWGKMKNSHTALLMPDPRTSRRSRRSKTHGGAASAASSSPTAFMSGRRSPSKISSPAPSRWSTA
jgi:hypothetical protein